MKLFAVFLACKYQFPKKTNRKHLSTVLSLMNFLV